MNEYNKFVENFNPNQTIPSRRDDIDDIDDEAIFSESSKKENESETSIAKILGYAAGGLLVAAGISALFRKRNPADQMRKIGSELHPSGSAVSLHGDTLSGLIVKLSDEFQDLTIPHEDGIHETLAVTMVRQIELSSSDTAHSPLLDLYREIAISSNRLSQALQGQLHSGQRGERLGAILDRLDEIEGGNLRDHATDEIRHIEPAEVPADDSERTIIEVFAQTRDFLTGERHSRINTQSLKGEEIEYVLAELDILLEISISSILDDLKSSEKGRQIITQIKLEHPKFDDFLPENVFKILRDYAVNNIRELDMNSLEKIGKLVSTIETLHQRSADILNSTF